MSMRHGSVVVSTSTLHARVLVDIIGNCIPHDHIDVGFVSLIGDVNKPLRICCSIILSVIVLFCTLVLSVLQIYLSLCCIIHSTCVLG